MFDEKYHVGGTAVAGALFATMLELIIVFRIQKKGFTNANPNPDP